MFDNLPGKIWMNGQLVDWSEAKIHVMSHSLHYATGIFEGIRAYAGKPFLAEKHYERFINSAKVMGYELPYNLAQLMTATKEVLEAGQYNQAYIRALAWLGSKVMTVSQTGADVNVMIAAWERPTVFPERFYTDGLRLNVATYHRPSYYCAPVNAKAACLYAVSAISKAESEKMGYDDAIMLDTFLHDIAEATSSNIFVVTDNVLMTPKTHSCLKGITRQVVLSLVESHFNLYINETNFGLNMLDDATEVFLTGTAIEILPVGLIEDKRTKWTFKPGPVTLKLMTLYKKVINGEIKLPNYHKSWF